jgi:hypothetical protein
MERALMIKAVKYWTHSGGIMGVDVGEAVPTLPAGLAALVVPMGTDVDPALHYVVDETLGSRELVRLPGRTVLVDEPFALGVPSDSHWTFNGAPGAGNETRQLAAAGDYQLTLQGKFCGATMVLARTIDQLRSARWIEAKAYRDQRMNGGCATPLGQADTDAESRIKISGAVQMAMLAKSAGTPFELIWTMADNTPHPHDADQMIQLGMAVGSYIQACQNAGTTVRAQLEAAGTIEDLQAVDVTTGYP